VEVRKTVEEVLWVKRDRILGKKGGGRREPDFCYKTRKEEKNEK